MNKLIVILGPTASGKTDLAVFLAKKIRTIKIIKDIQRRGKTPFLVGGTGLYIKAVVENLQIPKVAPNPALREKLEKKTNEELLKDLAKLDPQAAETIDRK